jgi:hypothetical protein
MKKNKIAQYCCIALVAVGFGLNIQNAIENYGLGEDSHSLVADGDSSTGSDSSSGPDTSNGDSNGNSNGSSNDSSLVPNGKVSVIEKTNLCYSLDQTETTQTFTYTDPITGESFEVTEIWFEYNERTYYDCKLVDYDKVGWSKLCETPNSFEGAHCTMTQKPHDFSAGGRWF